MGDNKKSTKDVARRIWSNYVVRNIILAISLLVIVLCVVSILLNVFTRHNKYKDVPNFIGVTMEEAAKLASTDRLRIEVNDSLYVPKFAPGVILEQNPDAGTKVKSGRRIFVTVNSFRQKIMNVPYVAGYSLRQAKSILETAGLEIARLVYVEDIATNNVLEQSLGHTAVTPESKLKAEKGTGITLKVGRAPGAEPAVVPEASGLFLRDAKSRIWDAGLNVGRVVYDNDITMLNQQDARVWQQSPQAGRRAGLGSEITIYMTVDREKIARGLKSSENAAKVNVRRDFVADSLSRAGLTGDELESEIEYVLMQDKQK